MKTSQQSKREMQVSNGFYRKCGHCGKIKHSSTFLRVATSPDGWSTSCLQCQHEERRADGPATFGALPDDEAQALAEIRRRTKIVRGELEAWDAADRAMWAEHYQELQARGEKSAYVDLDRRYGVTMERVCHVHVVVKALRRRRA